MPTVSINGIPYAAPVDMPLSTLFAHLGIPTDHPCGGRGTCQKCTVLVNGQPELSCRYVIRGDVSVEVDAPASIVTPLGHDGKPLSVWLSPKGEFVPPPAECTALVLDIGTTTLELGCADTRTGHLVYATGANNPQRTYGADVMSRISYAAEHGIGPLTAPLRAEIQRLLDEFMARWSLSPCPLYVTGNTTMLHLFLGVDPTPMGKVPHTPAFLEQRHLSPADCSLRGPTSVTALPGFSAFVGADLVAGLHYVGLPEGDRWRLLVDLGTNAEILLYNRERILCTAAAAGPCFEGACISSGMSAAGGAICSYDPDGSYETIENIPPVGICGTGLVDVIAVLLERGIVDETGYMNTPAFYLCEDVSLVQEDIRQYQLAKSAIHAAIGILIRRAGITYADVEGLYIAGGLASVISVENAIRTGLLPRELGDRCTPLTNSALLGTARYTADHADLSAYTHKATYIDLAADPSFANAFIEGMSFE